MLGKWNAHLLLLGMEKWYIYSGKQFCSFLIELNMHLTNDPSVLLLDIYPSELKNNVHTKIWMQMCIAASFTATKTWR